MYTGQSKGESPVYLDPNQPIDKRVENLLGRMTLDKEVGQMCRYSVFSEGVEAFNEHWKEQGSEDWDLFTEGRKVKLAMQALHPDHLPKGPTSPSYDQSPVPQGTQGQ